MRHFVSHAFIWSACLLLVSSCKQIGLGTKDGESESTSSNSSGSFCKINARANFNAKVNPVLISSCLSCHGSSGGAFSLSAASPDANYLRIAPQGQRVLTYGTGGNNHPGGTRLDATQSQIISEWLTQEADCKKQPEGGGTGGTPTEGLTCGRPDRPADPGFDISTPKSNAGRMSGEVFGLRAAALFGPDEVGNGRLLDPKLFGLYTSTGNLKALARPERFTSAVTQNAFQAISETLCTKYGKKPLTTAGTIFADDFLLSGEASWPSEDNLAIALKVARNAWLYPYNKTDKEVLALSKLYLDVIEKQKSLNKSVADQQASARASVCVAALMSPQFWYGNPGELDVLRRVSLEVFRTLPTPRQFIDFSAAGDKTAWLRTYVKSMQSPGNSKGYLQAIKYWHDDWLGLRPFKVGPVGSIDFIKDPREFNEGLVHATGGLAPVMVNAAAITTPGPLKDATVLTVAAGRTDIWPGVNDREKRDHILQPFDPRTTELRWEQYNPKVGDWEVIGGWIRTPTGDYEEIAGSITLNDGSKRTTSAADINFGLPWWIVNNRLGDFSYSTPLAENQWTYKNLSVQPSRLVGTPVEVFTADQRRLRRWSPSGEQNGVSKVILPLSGDVAYVGNALSRFWFTCSFRAPKGYQPATNWRVDDTAINPKDGYWGYSWNGLGLAWPDTKTGKPTTRMPRPGARGYGGTQMLETIAHPTLLGFFRCGIPNTLELAKTPALAVTKTAVDDPAYNDGIAYPLGYKDYTGAIKASDLNELASNIGYIGAIPGAEGLALNTLRDDIALETTRLVYSLLEDGSSDYRKILTSSETIGSAYLEQHYRSGGRLLPFSLPNFDLGANPTAIRTFSAERFMALPIGWFRGPYEAGKNSLSVPETPTVLGGEAIKWLDVSKSSTLPHRPLSGILTQASFWAPVASSPRTMANRIFVRLLGQNANVFKPSVSQMPIHMKYVTQKSHVAPSCASCHANLDPLAAILNPNFAADPMMKNGSIAKLSGELSAGVGTFLPTIQGVPNPSSGAFLGKEIKGIRELGQAIVDSREWARQTVSKAAENILGRPFPPYQDCVGSMQNPDCQLIEGVTDAFRDASRLNFNYNRMVEEIIASPLNRRSN